MWLKRQKPRQIIILFEKYNLHFGTIFHKSINRSQNYVCFLFFFLNNFLISGTFFLAWTLSSLASLSIVPGTAKSFQDLTEVKRIQSEVAVKREKVNAYNFLPGITFSFFPFTLKPYTVSILQKKHPAYDTTCWKHKALF